MWALQRDDTGLVCSDFSRYGRVSRVVSSAQKNTAELGLYVKVWTEEGGNHAELLYVCRASACVRCA